MKKPVAVIFAIVVESSLLLVMFILFLGGLLGMVLPVLPGLFFIFLGVAIYSFLLKSQKTKITPRLHRHVLKTRDYFVNLTIYQNFMGIIKAFKAKKVEKIREQIIKNGVILFSFNLALSLALFFVLMALSTLAALLSLNLIAQALMPLVVIFLFAGTCSIIWYRFGQILGSEFKEKKVVYAGWVVLISIIPLVLLLFFIGLIIGASGLLASVWGGVFIGTFFITTLAVIFEMFIISLGVITKTN